MTTLQAVSASRARRPLVLKFGGELLEVPASLTTIVEVIGRAASVGDPLVIVHGGGKEIDAALKVFGIPKVQVDGLRVTDDATLDVVVSVLAGAVNTRLVAALTTAGVAAVGLTGADAGCGRSTRAPRHHAVDGRIVDLGRVGLPDEQADVRVIEALLENRFVPVIASIGLDQAGGLLNVNADTFAGHVAARLAARRLVIAGTTAGVLDEQGGTVAELNRDAIDRMIGSGTATAGMIAKLRSCAQALLAGVDDVLIVDGRDRGALEAAAVADFPTSGTRIVQTAA